MMECGRIRPPESTEGVEVVHVLSGALMAWVSLGPVSTREAHFLLAAVIAMLWGC